MLGILDIACSRLLAYCQRGVLSYYVHDCSYDGKVDWQDLSRFDEVDLSSLAPEVEPGIEVYTAELYQVTFKRWLRAVVLV